MCKSFWHKKSTIRCWIEVGVLQISASNPARQSTINQFMRDPHCAALETRYFFGSTPTPDVLYYSFQYLVNTGGEHDWIRAARRRRVAPRLLEREINWLSPREWELPRSWTSVQVYRDVRVQKEPSTLNTKNSKHFGGNTIRPWIKNFYNAPNLLKTYLRLKYKFKLKSRLHASLKS